MTIPFKVRVLDQAGREKTVYEVHADGHVDAITLAAERFKSEYPGIPFDRRLAQAELHRN
jgi:hypothetical protein